MDFGLITPILKRAKEYPGLECQIVTMSAHNASGFYDDGTDLVAAQGLKVAAALQTLARDDSAFGVAETLSATAREIGKAYTALKPDLVVIPGDRYEMMACASVAAVMGLPVAHLYGGDVSFGAFDESFRHAITKLSHLHFVTNEDARRRVVQMGENPDHVYNFGAPALDMLGQMDYLDQEALGQTLGVRFGAYNILITYHPTTLSGVSAKQEMTAVLEALAALPQDHHLFFTMPGPDNDGQVIAAMIHEFIKQRQGSYAFSALGTQRYLSLMKVCNMVLGNSSSGFYEAPSFKIPTVNIGDRQKGRMAADSVLHVACEKTAILNVIQEAKSRDFSSVVNPYFKQDVSGRILQKLSEFQSFKPLLHKSFFNHKVS